MKPQTPETLNYWHFALNKATLETQNTRPLESRASRLACTRGALPRLRPASRPPPRAPAADASFFAALQNGTRAAPLAPGEPWSAALPPEMAHTVLLTCNGLHLGQLRGAFPLNRTLWWRRATAPPSRATLPGKPPGQTSRCTLPGHPPGPASRASLPGAREAPGRSVSGAGLRAGGARERRLVMKMSGAGG